MIKEAKTKKERLMAMAGKMLGMVCVNGKGDVILLKSDYDRKPNIKIRPISFEDQLKAYLNCN